MSTSAPLAWPFPLERRLGGKTLLSGTEIYYDFNWFDKFGHDRSVFPNCKSIGKKISGLTPPGYEAVLLLTERTDVPVYSIDTTTPATAVHILNVDAVVEVSADPADSLFGRHAVPDISLASTIDQLREIPGALEALLMEQLEAQTVLTWASSDDGRINDLLSAVKSLDPLQVARIAELALSIVATIAPPSDLLAQSTDEIDGDILRMAAVGAAYASQDRAVAELEELLKGSHAEATFQKFFEKEHWMFGSQFVGRWEGRNLTLGNQQDLILLTPDGFVDLIELKLPSDPVFRWDESRNSYYPAPALAKAIGQVQKYLFDIDSEFHQIRSRFGVDVHRARGVIVIGAISSDDQDLREALRGLNAHLSRIEVWTYTHVLAAAKAILRHTNTILNA